MTDAPIAPENVRYVLADGSEYPCEMAFVGTDPDGTDVWENTVTPPSNVVSLRADTIPGHARLRFAFHMPEEGR